MRPDPKDERDDATWPNFDYGITAPETENGESQDPGDNNDE